MKFRMLVSLFLLGLCTASAESVPQLIEIDRDRLPSEARKKITECQEDLAAILADQKPVHAKFGEELFDGGTTFWQGDGYTITIWKRFCRIGGVDGTLMGPEVQLDTSITDDSVFPKISFVRFIAWHSQDKKSHDQGIKPTPEAVKQPAAQESRRP